MIIVFCVTTILFLLNNDSTPYSFAFAPRRGGKGGMRRGKGSMGGGKGGKGSGQDGENSGQDGGSSEQCCPCSGIQAPSQDKLLAQLKKLKELQGKGPQGKGLQGKGPQSKGLQGKGPQGKGPQGKGLVVNDSDNKSIPDLDLIINTCKKISPNDIENCVLSLSAPNKPQNSKFEPK